MKKECGTRLAWMDAARGIGIILVVAGHAFRDGMRVESAVSEWIYQMIIPFTCRSFSSWRAWLFPSP